MSSRRTSAWRNAQLAPEERSMILVDAKTGREIEPVVVDATTGERIDGPGYVYAAGPAAGDVMRQRYEGVAVTDRVRSTSRV